MITGWKCYIYIVVRENVFWIQEQWFIYKAKPEKFLFSPYPYHICLSVGLNSIVILHQGMHLLLFLLLFLISYWQNTLQNVLLQSISQCFICFFPPSLSLLKSSSMPACELHITTVLSSKKVADRLLLQIGCVTAVGEHYFSMDEYKGHSSHNFFVPFGGRHDLLSLTDGLWLAEERPKCISTKPKTVA